MVARRRTPAAGGRPRGWLLIVAALAVLAVIFATLWLIFAVFVDEDVPVGPQDAATVSNIVQDPEKYYEQRVTIDARVEEVLSPVAFVVSGDVLTGAGPEELLVIGPPPQIVAEDADEDVRGVEEPFVHGDFVQITGEVREFDRAMIEQEVGAELDNGRFAEFEGEPVLITEGIDLTGRILGPEGMIADSSDVLANPEDFSDERVTISEAIEQSIGPNAFTIGEGLLVINTIDQITEDALAVGVIVDATGVVQEFDQAAIEAEHDIQFDTEAMESFAGEPALIADTMRIIAEAEN